MIKISHDEHGKKVVTGSLSTQELSEKLTKSAASFHAGVHKYAKEWGEVSTCTLIETIYCGGFASALACFGLSQKQIEQVIEDSKVGVFKHK